MRNLDAEQIFDHANDAWPGVDEHDLIWIAPLGSRKDALIFNRKLRQVTTGRRGSEPCFKGSLKDFEEKLEDDYGRRLETPYGDLRVMMRLRAEYRTALGFFKMLPDM